MDLGPREYLHLAGVGVGVGVGGGGGGGGGSDTSGDLHLKGRVKCIARVLHMLRIVYNVEISRQRQPPEVSDGSTGAGAGAGAERMKSDEDMHVSAQQAQQAQQGTDEYLEMWRYQSKALRSLCELLSSPALSTSSIVAHHRLAIEYLEKCDSLANSNLRRDLIGGPAMLDLTLSNIRYCCRRVEDNEVVVSWASRRQALKNKVGFLESIQALRKAVNDDAFC